MLNAFASLLQAADANSSLWHGTKMDVTISEDGVNATTNATYRKNEVNVYAEKGFAISGKNGGKGPGIIIYYFEVTQKSFR
jgi:hypothetical protein